MLVYSDIYDLRTIVAIGPLGVIFLRDFCFIRPSRVSSLCFTCGNPIKKYNRYCDCDVTLKASDPTDY